MSAEQNLSEVQSHQGPPPNPDSGMQGDEAGSNVPHGMGQSKSSRRRRRKRKNKGPETAVGAQTSGSEGYASSAGEPVSIQAAAAPIAQPYQSQRPMPSQNQPHSSQPQSFQAGAQQHSNNNSAGTKRWKKKFRDRDRPRTPENPGNIASGSGFSNGHGGGSGSGGSGSNGGGGFRDATTHQPGNGGGGFKRKGGGGKQQRGPRSFVGPMDHSYRAVNGNFSDTPPSTIETQGNYQGRNNGGGSRGGYHSDSQPIDYSQGRSVPIAADAPTRIYFFIEDLFFIAKIQETARKIGVKVAFIKNEKEAVAELVGGEEEDRPGLIVFDLNNASAKPLTLIPKLKAKLKRSTSIVGFLSHLQGDLKAKAVEAGCDTVMPRAAFSQNLPNLLRRYGIQDEEEGNFNQ